MNTGQGETIIAHISDPHLCCARGMEWLNMLNKRLYGYLSWRLRRGGEHQNEVLGALARDVEETEPHHIVVTGDLTHLGLPEEFHRARSMLRSLGPASSVTAVPGNHDTYISTQWKDTLRVVAEYMSSDKGQPSCRSEQEEGLTFPFVRVRGNTALIGVSSARPSPPFLAVGTVGEVQMDELGHILTATGRKGLFRIVVIHHPPVPGVVSRRKGLTDRARFEDVVARAGVELLLHGHTHRSSFARFETRSGPRLAAGVPSASALGRTPQRTARYNVYRVTDRGDYWTLGISVRAYSSEEGCFKGAGTVRVSVAK